MIYENGNKKFIKNSYVYDKFRFIELLIRLVTGKIHEPGFEYLKFINKEALVVDIGANVGQSIVSIFNANSSLNIIAFEPNPSCKKSLNQLSKLWFLKNRVSLLFLGLGSATGRMSFFIPVTGSGIRLLQEGTFDRSVLFSRVTRDRLGCTFSVDEIICDIRSLDEFEIIPSFIKIDVQGFELEVLRGSSKTIGRHKPGILIENGDYIDSVSCFLGGFGYIEKHLESTLNRLYLHPEGPLGNFVN